MPNTHILKVHTGSDGSSVLGTVKRTCSIGDSSSSSSCVMGLVGGDSVATVPIVADSLDSMGQDRC